MMTVFYKKEVSLIIHIKSACAKDLRQDSVCILREQGSGGGGRNRAHKGRAVADKVIETMDQILQSPEYL